MPRPVSRRGIHRESTMPIHLQIIGADGAPHAEAHGETEAQLIYSAAYAPGDRIVVRTDRGPAHVWARLDTSLACPLLWLPEGCLDYATPFGDAAKAFAPFAFGGERHFLEARLATSEEIATRRDLALNPFDFADSAVFPHASASSVTRGEALFAARNVIDGLTATGGHGEWPFTSWGINRDPEAELTVTFGRPVLLDEVVLHTRADFPHDAWWESAVLSFSEGTDLVVDLKKTGHGQRVRFPTRSTEWVRLHHLIKADDPSPFPALTSIVCMGRDVQPDGGDAS